MTEQQNNATDPAEQYQVDQNVQTEGNDLDALTSDDDTGNVSNTQEVTPEQPTVSGDSDYVVEEPNKGYAHQAGQPAVGSSAPEPEGGQDSSSSQS